MHPLLEFGESAVREGEFAVMTDHQLHRDETEPRVSGEFAPILKSDLRGLRAVHGTFEFLGKDTRKFKSARRRERRCARNHDWKRTSKMKFPDTGPEARYEVLLTVAARDRRSLSSF